MSDILFERPYATITLDEDFDGLLVKIWGHVPSNDFREILESALDLLKARQLHCWLLDIREQNVSSLSDLDWAAKDWIPRSVAAGLTHSATLTPKDVITVMGLNRVTKLMGEVPGEFLRFDTLEEARQWLISKK